MTCDQPGCRLAAAIRGYCQQHYRRGVRHGTIKTNRINVFAREKAGATCGICGRSVYKHATGEFCHVNRRMDFA